MIQVKQVNHTFLIGKKGKEKKVPVLKGLSFEVKQGRNRGNCREKWLG